MHETTRCPRPSRSASQETAPRRGTAEQRRRECPAHSPSADSSVQCALSPERKEPGIREWRTAQSAASEPQRKPFYPQRRTGNGFCRRSPREHAIDSKPLHFSRTRHVILHVIFLLFYMLLSSLSFFAQFAIHLARNPHCFHDFDPSNFCAVLFNVGRRNSNVFVSNKSFNFLYRTCF